jgi:hypothetical protein
MKQNNSDQSDIIARSKGGMDLYIMLAKRACSSIQSATDITNSDRDYYIGCLAYRCKLRGENLEMEDNK